MVQLNRYLGNICIAGHNYDNGTFFSNIPELSAGDIIYFRPINNKTKCYTIYKKYETSLKDISCTNQNTYGKFEITLVTCNNYNGARIIVKAKQLND